MKSGFSIDVFMNEKVYTIGERSLEEFRENIPIDFDDFLPKWNYTFRLED